MSESSATSHNTSRPAATLVPSWPQLPRPAYALAPIPASSIVRSTAARAAASASLRSSSYERSAPYPSARPPRVDMLQVQPPAVTSAAHETELFRTRQALQSHLAQRQQPPASSRPPANQPSRSTTNNLHSHSADTSSSTQSGAKEAQHKVYLLNCKHCGNFLSDRGMKAVLLLKPNITLYSTDIVPSTCGPFFGGSAFHGGVDSSEAPVERTCQCLTQSLGCYGCGAQVGYNIISPCARCTSSVMKHSRSSNGHRTVLHCSEIAVRERRYIPGEPGVRPQPTPCSSQASLNSAQVYADPLHDERLSQTAQSDLFRRSNVSRRDIYRLQYGFYEEELEAEKADASSALYFEQAQQYRDLRPSGSPPAHDPDSAPFGGNRVAASSSSFSSSSKKGRVLQRGDALYWSDLIAGGERAQPFDPDAILERPVVGR
ncbi:hypothetical protein PHSY_004730 [Pseudozyma hubeiensis SY62]|uniref:Uncharacterized protein n=1 Tax=Pseudozyma hubeiensis (strain SY62) TaxID=1305764 RepID=R9PGA4_PSEHS|nr:hypothetical protein PHSY_004730 [Pseudozyma hubeiensis SY62]GAC97145.1 hypothetical protein PHSY_004730 [Pseudozyma hubeiensis SY62]